jgi:hypothetical protein
MNKFALVITVALVAIIIVFTWGFLVGTAEIYVAAAILGTVAAAVDILVVVQNRLSELGKKRRKVLHPEIDVAIQPVRNLLEHDWQKITGNGIDVIKEIRSYYRNVESPCAKELADLSNQIAKGIESRNTKGDMAIWDGERFRLVEFSEGRTAEENLELTLTFENSRYSNFLATIQYLEQEITVDGKKMSRRGYYLRNTNPRENIVPDLVSDFGVSLLVVTSDKKFVFTKRKALAVSPHQIHLSCHEGLARGGANPDFDEHKKPDVFRAAIRSLDEELFITDILPHQICWILFGHDKTTWEYNLHGIVYIEKTWKDVKDRFEILAKDANLEHYLYEPPIRANIEEVVNFLRKEWNTIHPLAKNAIFYSLINATNQPNEALRAFQELSLGQETK